MIFLRWLIGLAILLSGMVRAGYCETLPVYQHDQNWPVVLEQFNWGVDKDKEPDNSTSATGVGVDRKNGLVYVLVRVKPYVRVFTEDGRFVKAWSPEGSVNVHMLHIDQDANLWIADNGAHTVTKYTPGGKVLLTLGTYGAPGMDGRHFNGPTDVATTDDGRFVFVSDGYGNNRITKFDQSGKYLGMWGGAATGLKPGEFHLPHSITIIDKTLYVADRSGGRIQLFDLDGNFIEDWRDVSIPWGLAAYDGHLYVAGAKLADSPYKTTAALTAVTRMSLAAGYKATTPPMGQNILVFDTSGTLVQDIPLPQGKMFGAVDWVHGIDIGAHGDIYITDVIGNHAQKWRRVETGLY